MPQASRFLQFLLIFALSWLTTLCAAAQQSVDAPSLVRDPIVDPHYSGITAFTVLHPEGWLFQGAVLTPAGCRMPSPVFRDYSPDGLSEIRL